MFRDFPTFSGTWMFFLLRLSLFDLLSSSLLFSDSSHLCFSFAHIVGSLTSRLPSISFHTLTLHSLGCFTGVTCHLLWLNFRIQRIIIIFQIVGAITITVSIGIILVVVSIRYYGKLCNSPISFIFPIGV